MRSKSFGRRQFIHLGALCGACAMLGWRIHAGPPGSEPACQYRRQMEKIRPWFTKKKKPGRNDWLAHHEEPGQTFEEYRASQPNRPTAGRAKLYLQTLGDFTHREIHFIGILQRFMRIVFGLEVVILPAQPLDIIPAHARRRHPDGGKLQLLSTHILRHVLTPARPDDAVAVLAITNEDLWPGGGWNFVFGQASLVDRVGIWSTARMGDPEKEPRRFLRRILQVAVHETGHMFGIRHCIAYECCMNGSNHLAESDRTPLVFCPECDAKLWWACGLNARQRAAALHEFALSHQLEPDATRRGKIAKSLAE